jgi:DNA-directed RNA polymerase
LTELLTQREVEEGMYAGGVKRAELSALRLEQTGKASENPYAKEVYREFVLPVAAQILDDIQTKGVGRRQAHVALLEDLDAEAVAFLAVRTTLNTLMQHGLGTELANVRGLSTFIGRSIFTELLLRDFDAANPELYYTLARDFQRRMSKSERHRLNAMRHEAKKNGIKIREWPLGAREQVGMYLLSLLEGAGMIEILPMRIVNGRNVPADVVFTASLLVKLDKIKAYVALTSPVYGPCVEPPCDWVSGTDGGFHTPRMRRAAPLLVRGPISSRHLYREAHMPTVLTAVNALQRTAWRINQRMLDIVFELSKAGGSGDEIVGPGFTAKPVAPDWLSPDMGVDAMTAAQETQFRAWKLKLAEWYTQRKISGSRYNRFYAATRTANQFREYPALYFVHFADTRGRVYPYTYGVSPQGSDLQKSLIEFAEGKPLDTPEARRWFLIHGANKYGFDKADLFARALWVSERHELWLHIAADPINHREWEEADKPLQFLAWCLEYAESAESDDFVSHLPISMDGSCNGLQNLSAMLRDEIGGAATNLMDNAKMADIYQIVADKCRERMEATQGVGEVEESMRLRWLNHGISRTVVKRTVMTTPYGVTQQSAQKYVVSDYLSSHPEAGFDRPEWRAASMYLMQFLWPAIGDVVVKGRQIMDWLKKGSRKIAKKFPKGEEPVIWWVTPSGFPASQCYFEQEVHRIRTHLHGDEKIRLYTETDDPDVNSHTTGMAPNFVHSMDASHLHLTAAAATGAGIGSLAMIHDDYGTHAADAATLYRLIREQFVWMYEQHDPLRSLQAKYPLLGVPPDRGDLDITEVLRSNFFFS